MRSQRKDRHRRNIQVIAAPGATPPEAAYPTETQILDEQAGDPITDEQADDVILEE